MLLAVVNSWSISENEEETINNLIEKYPEIKELRDEIIERSDKIIEELQKVYNNANLDIRDFENEKQAIIKSSWLFFAFKALALCVTKSGQKIVTLSEMYNKINSEKKLIKKAHEDYINELKNELEKKDLELANKIVHKHDKNILKLKENAIINVPNYYGKTKTNSVQKLISGIELSLEDIDIDSNGNIVMSGTKIKQIKKEIGRNGNESPKGIKNKDQIIIKK